MLFCQICSHQGKAGKYPGTEFWKSISRPELVYVNWIHTPVSCYNPGHTRGCECKHMEDHNGNTGKILYVHSRITANTTKHIEGASPFHQDNSLVPFGPEIESRIIDVYGRTIDQIVDEYICIVESTRVEGAPACNYIFQMGEMSTILPDSSAYGFPLTGVMFMLGFLSL